jgi:hypothetical protein
MQNIILFLVDEFHLMVKTKGFHSLEICKPRPLFSRPPKAAEASPPVAAGNPSKPPTAAQAGRRSRPML